MAITRKLTLKEILKVYDWEEIFTENKDVRYDYMSKQATIRFEVRNYRDKQKPLRLIARWNNYCFYDEWFKSKRKFAKGFKELINAIEYFSNMLEKGEK